MKKLFGKSLLLVVVAPLFAILTPLCGLTAQEQNASVLVLDSLNEVPTTTDLLANERLEATSASSPDPENFNVNDAYNAPLTSRALDCILVPNKTIEVSSPVEGVLDRLLIERGDRVHKGQRIMQLHSEIEQAQVALAKERAFFGDRTVARNDQLGELLSDHEKDEIFTDAQMAKLELQEIETRLQMKTLKSPISGLVIETHREEGEFVSEEPVVTIVSIDPLYAEIVAPVSFLGKVEKGDIATLDLEYLDKQGLQAKVKTVDPVIDAASGTFRIRLELPNPKAAIPSGLRCKVGFD